MLLQTLLSWFHPAIDALLSRDIPLDYRWRLLLFQPLALLIYALNAVPPALSRRARTIYIPARDGRQLRALLYLPPKGLQGLRPLHLDIHGGAFIAGGPEGDYRFCTALSDRADTIVVSTTYRFAPRNKFPAAIDDVDDAVDWLLANAEKEFGADVSRFTLGGCSAGGNLAMATSMREGVREKIKSVVTFYAPIDVSTPPAQKPRPSNYPTRDPLAFLEPLYDSYGLSARQQGHKDDPRSSPCKASCHQLPDRILMVVPMIDILVAEQLNFAARINSECEKTGKSPKVEVMVMENGFHGWLELPDGAIDPNSRRRVFDKCVEFIRALEKSA